MDMDAVRAQQRELSGVSDEILTIKRRLMRYQEALDDGWKSVEVKGIDSCLRDTIQRLNRLTGDLEDLEYDVAATGEEIRAEEEMRRRAEEEARRWEEEMQKRTEEEARRREEEARKRAEEEARRSTEEEARKREEETQRQEAQRRAAANKAKKWGIWSWLR